MTNEELIEKYRSGDETVLTKLCRANERLVIKIARTFHQDGYELDDFISEAWLGFLDAVREFDSARGVAFASFASLKMRQHLIDVVRSYGTVSRQMPGPSTSFETIDLYGASSAKWESDDALLTEPAGENNVMSERVREVVAELPTEERAVVEAIYYRNETQVSTAEKMKVSRQRVQRLETSALESMKKALSH
jgi:RNA polymerase sigma factor (sigma-70 family)